MPLVLLPGYMTDADLWRDMREGLAPFAPVVEADLSRDGSIEAMARRVLDDAPERFALLGFSMGGYVAREIVRTAPERVAALILVATSGRGDSDAEAQRKAALSLKASRMTFAGLSRSAVASSLHPDRSGDDEMIHRIQAMGARLGAEVFRRQSLMERRGDLDRLSAICCPTLIIAADHDRLRSVAEAEELQAGITGSSLIVIEGVGHMIPIEAPERLLEVVVGWLDREIGTRT